MATPFAIAADLLDREWSGTASSARIDVALADASAFLRAEIGWQVYPAVTVTQRAREWADVVHLHGSPVQSITSVTVGGATLVAGDYDLDGSVLYLTRPGAGVVVTYVVGYDSPPDELVSWTCVLAADELARADDPDDTGGARPAAESLADWRITYSKRQQDGELAIPQRVLNRLRASYGTSTYVTS